MNIILNSKNEENEDNGGNDKMTSMKMNMNIKKQKNIFKKKKCRNANCRIGDKYGNKTFNTMNA